MLLHPPVQESPVFTPLSAPFHSQPQAFRSSSCLTEKTCQWLYPWKEITPSFFLLSPTDTVLLRVPLGLTSGMAQCEMQKAEKEQAPQYAGFVVRHAVQPWLQGNAKGAE